MSGEPNRARNKRRPRADVASSSPETTPPETAPQGREPVTHLVVGRVVGAHGVQGELRVRVESEDPDRFLDLQQVYLGDDLRRYRVAGVRMHRGLALVTLRGIDDRDAAEALRGQYVYVHMKDALPLGEGEYYLHQIEGLTVLTEEGEVLGRVTQVMTTGANDVYVVNGKQGEILLPAIPGVVLGVDLEAGQMTVRVPEGLR